MSDMEIKLQFGEDFATKSQEQKDFDVVFEDEKSNIAEAEENLTVAVSFEEPKKFNTQFGQFTGVGGTKDHAKLGNRDIPDQHPISSITGLEDALKEAAESGVEFTTDETLTLTPTGVLKVNTATEPQADNTLPITAAAVHATVGNIEILLGTI